MGSALGQHWPASQYSCFTRSGVSIITIKRKSTMKYEIKNVFHYSKADQDREQPNGPLMALSLHLDGDHMATYEGDSIKDSEIFCAGVVGTLTLLNPDATVVLAFEHVYDR